MASEPKYDLIVFGATSTVGRLVAEYLSSKSAGAFPDTEEGEEEEEKEDEGAEDDGEEDDEVDENEEEGEDGEEEIEDDENETEESVTAAAPFRWAMADSNRSRLSAVRNAVDEN